MKKLNKLIFKAALFALCLQAAPASAQQTTPNSSLKIGVVNAKKCLEESKLGKLEQANFEKMKTQMESVLKEKETSLEELETKLNDDDYMDSITEEAASELKRKRKTIRQEGYTLQNQYLQTLQQANMKVIQKLTEVISKASKEVAKDSAGTSQPLDIILNDEACTFFKPEFDVSQKIIVKMNAMFDAESKDSKPQTP